MTAPALLPGEAATPLDFALSYAARGWPVLPLHTPSDGTCSCRKGRDCDSPGKHPRIKRGVKEASTDRSTITGWWSKWPDANVGVRTGGRIVVLDVDCHDADGEASLALLELEHDELPQTLEARTGSGGRHLVFACPPDAGSPTNIVPGVDVRGPHTYIVAPPSLHASGGRYEWVNDLPVAELGEHPIVPMLRNRARAARAPKPPPATRSTAAAPTSSPNRNVARARGIVRSVCGRIATLADGRRQALLAGAHQLGGYIHLGLSRGEVEQALLEAARACGADSKHDVWRHIQYGLDTGEQTPLELPPDDDPPSGETWAPYDGAPEPPPEPQPSPGGGGGGQPPEGSAADQVDDAADEAHQARLAHAAIARLEAAADAYEAAHAAFDDEAKTAALSELDTARADADTYQGLVIAYEVSRADVMDPLLSRLAALLRDARRKSWADDLKRDLRAAVRARKERRREQARAEQAEPPPGADAAVWAELVMAGDPPTPARTRGNVEIILKKAAAYAGRFRWCEFSYRALIDGRERTDRDETRIATDIGNAYGIHFPPGEIAQMLDLVASEHPVHPVREYLQTLKWDGKPRIHEWLTRWVGAPDEPGVSAMGRRFLIGAVARIMRPGCKLDTVLVLAGPQGGKKSTAFKELFGEEYFSDSAVNIAKKDALEGLQGVWCWEWAELESTRKAEAATIKAFLSSAVDRYRPSYGRNVITRPRQVVMVASVNPEGGFLRDATGSRRFWVVPVRHKVNVHAIRGCRDELWAEAVAAYEAGEQWWLTPEEEAARKELAADFESVDPWTERVLAYARAHKPVSARDVLEYALHLGAREQTRAAEMRVASILTAAGWERRRSQTQGSRVRLWYPAGVA